MRFSVNLECDRVPPPASARCYGTPLLQKKITKDVMFGDGLSYDDGQS